MAVFLEFHVKGGGCALVEVGMIGAAMARGHDVFAEGSADTPTVVVLRGGETIDVVGESVGKVIARLVRAKQAFRSMPGADVYVDWITPLGGDDAADEPTT